MAPGQRIGTWRVACELGRGGMAAVYAVTHNSFGKRAALKLCHKSILGPEFTPETFLREARIVHLVEHPGVPDVFATGSFDGRPYLVMERLSGQTLGQCLDVGPVQRTEALEILLELCEILAVAHAANVVHRDLKLDNVFLLDRQGSAGRRIKLIDWGVAHVIGEPDPMRGMIAGSLTYVAPEQARGEAITGATDVYSLAVLAYQMLFGEPPFAAHDDLDLINKHLCDQPPAPASLWPEVPPELADLLLAMLAKEPARRPELDEVARVLEIVRGGLQQLGESTEPTWMNQLLALPTPPLEAVDPLGRPVGLAKLTLGVRQRLLGATLSVAAVIAALASVLGS